MKILEYFKNRIKLYKVRKEREVLSCYIEAGLKRKGVLIALCEKRYMDYVLKESRVKCLFSSIEDFRNYMFKFEFPYIENSCFLYGKQQKELDRNKEKLLREDCNPEHIVLHYSSGDPSICKYDYVLYAECIDVIGK